MKIGNTLETHWKQIEVSGKKGLSLAFYRLLIYFCGVNHTKMKKCKLSIPLFIIMFLAVLVVLMSCLYGIQVKNEQVQKAFYLFNQSVQEEAKIMDSDFMSFPQSDTGIHSDSIIIETEEGIVKYKRSKEVDSLTPLQKREWFDQMYIIKNNPNRAFMLDSLFQAELKKEGIVAQTAVRFFKGDTLKSCSNDSICQLGIALKPVIFGVKSDSNQITLQAYVLFSCSYLISQMPLLWGFLFSWVIGVFAIVWWWRKRGVNQGFVTPIPQVVTTLSSDTAELKKIGLNLFFNESTGELWARSHKVVLKRNRLCAFICFLQSPNHIVTYDDFCKIVLKRPLYEDDSIDKNKTLNQSIRKSMTQTIQRLRSDLKDFPELSIENVPDPGYRLVINN